MVCTLKNLANHCSNICFENSTKIFKFLNKKSEQVVLIAEKRDKLANICYLHMKHEPKKFIKSTFNEAIR